MKIIDDFEKKTKSALAKEEIILKCGNKVPIYTIENIYDLTQFVGYGKYVNCKDSKVYIRGQTQLYGGALVPSLYRLSTNCEHATSDFNRRINQLQTIRNFEKFPKSVLIATLQHYGIKTPQIDIVDNLWVALWFAMHEFDGTLIKSHDHIAVHSTSQEYGYIYLLASDAHEINDSKERGVYEGANTKVIDLRHALPSYYLRPHAQHAFMFQKKVGDISEYSDLIVGIAKIPTDKAQRWIGNTELLSVNVLFPSAYYDSGYEILLKHFPEWGPDVVRYRGSIQIISE